MNLKPFIRNHPVIAYYVLTFAISWGAGLALVGPGRFLGISSTSPEFMLVIGVGLLGPLAAGIILTAVVDGTAGLKQLVSRLRPSRRRARWYVVALLTFPLLSTAVILALSLTSPAFLPAVVTTNDKARLVFMAIVVGVMVNVCEEPGWTGFAAPRLLRSHGVLATGLGMGLLWGAWHLPAFAGSAASSGPIPPALYVAALLFGWLVPYRVLMAWAYARTGSLLVAILMHLPADVWGLILVPRLAGTEMLSYLVAFGGALWVVVAAVAIANGGRLTRAEDRPLPQAMAV
jgi:membrane protease YdiL (CAAX protease family)